MSAVIDALPSETYPTLADLKPGMKARIIAVIKAMPDDPVALRLSALGFVAGEPVRLVARGPIWAEPLLIEIGFTRFALRRTEAQRVHIEKDVA